MKSAFRVAALFSVYATIGFGGEYAISLLLGAPTDVSSEPVEMLRAEAHAPSQTVVHVEPAIVTRLQVRHAGECTYRDERRVTAFSVDLDVLRIRAGAGALHVEGQPGLEDVVVVGLVCASHEEHLQGLQVVLEASRPSELSVLTRYPQHDGANGRGNTARIDLTVLVPLGMDVEIHDSSGDITVAGTGSLDIEDSSGSVEVSGVLGSLRLDDSSGDVRVEDVAGDAEVDDGSGSLDIRGVEGSLTVHDGSGGLEIADVGQDVFIQDGSGSIEVTAVGGSLVVDRDGSGSIRHTGVEGRVDLPTPRRRRGG